MKTISLCIMIGFASFPAHAYAKEATPRGSYGSARTTLDLERCFRTVLIADGDPHISHDGSVERLAYGMGKASLMLTITDQGDARVVDVSAVHRPRADQADGIRSCLI